MVSLKARDLDLGMNLRELFECKAEVEEIETLLLLGAKV